MRRNLTVLLSTLLVTGLPALLYVQQAALEEESFGVVLRATARIALLIYLLIFVARPLRQLAPHGPGSLLLRNRRSLGIAFAAVMSVHLVFLIWLNGIELALAGMAVYALIYLMLITSFNGPAAALGPRRWKWLHKTGLYVIGIGLAQAQFGRIARGVGEPEHYVLALLILAAIGIRVTAWWNTRRTAASP